MNQSYRTIEIKLSELILRRPRSWRGRLEGWPAGTISLVAILGNARPSTRSRAPSSGRGLMDDNRDDSYHGNTLLGRYICSTAKCSIVRAVGEWSRRETMRNR